MAFDEYCLESLLLDEPVFYLWRNCPSVIVGLNQNVYSEVNLDYLRSHGITLARRVTGGGAVYHDLQNLNYTIMGRSRVLDDSCPEYMHLMVDALRRLGVPAELSGRNDIMVDGRKVSGYAKRVWKDRIMIHGTLMFDVDIETLQHVLDVPGSKLNRASGISSVHSRVANLKSYLSDIADITELAARLHEILAAGDPEYRLQDSDLRSIRQLAADKFSTWEWIYARSPRASLCRSSKFSCGTVEVSMDVVDGRISGLEFNGDYMGNLSSDGIAAALNGVECRREEIYKALTELPVSACFDGLSAVDLTNLILP